MSCKAAIGPAANSPNPWTYRERYTARSYPSLHVARNRKCIVAPSSCIPAGMARPDPRKGSAPPARLQPQAAWLVDSFSEATAFGPPCLRVSLRPRRQARDGDQDGARNADLVESKPTCARARAAPSQMTSMG